ncbi:MAG: type II toxin-antitoxin system Phd/YefM family antitoxin [Candidatus Eremiobacterota bacterium]
MAIWDGRRRRYTIAEARDQLARIVHAVESEGPVEFTRRGKPVAVLVSLSDYGRSSELTFWVGSPARFPYPKYARRPEPRRIS